MQKHFFISGFVCFFVDQIFHMKKLLLLLAVATVGFTACKKDEEVTPAKSDLIAKSWKAVDVKLNGVSFPISLFGNPIFTVAKNGTYTEISFGDTTTGTWAFYSNETKFILDSGTPDADTLNIVNLTASEFKLSGEDDGDIAEVTYNPN